jgi:hypothetical protein
MEDGNDKKDGPKKVDPTAEEWEALKRRRDEIEAARQAAPEGRGIKSLEDEFRSLGERMSKIAAARGTMAPTGEFVDREPVEFDVLQLILPRFVTHLRFGTQELADRVQRKEAIEQAREACEGDERKIVFTGHSGTGKTSLVAAAIRHRFGGKINLVQFAEARRMAFARDLYPMGHGMPPEVERAMKAPLLVLDDLGQDPYPGIRNSAVPELVSGRYEAGRRLWVTTWLSRAEMTRRYGDGFARRILQDATIIQCGNRAVDMEKL